MGGICYYSIQAIAVSYTHLICREGGTVLTVTENGKGRRSDIDTYRITARGGKGIRNYDAAKDKMCIRDSGQTGEVGQGQ